MSASKHQQNPFLYPGDLENTVCEVSQALSLVRAAVTGADTEPVEISHDQSCALDAILRGLYGALTYALGEISDAKDDGRLQEVRRD